METGKKSAIISRSIQDNKPKESTSADIRALKIIPGPDISAPIQSSSRKIARQALRETPELTRDQSLFVDPDVFDPGHMPEQFMCREAQIRELAMQVRPALRQVHMRPSSGTGAGITVVAEERRGYDPGYWNKLRSTGPGKPYNCVCRGLPGTGKTSSIKALFSEIDVLTNRVLPVYVSCEADKTPFSVCSRIFQEAGGHQLPSSGTSFADLYNATLEKVKKEGKALLVCLDDAQLLCSSGQINPVLSMLLRAHETEPTVKAGVIIVISDPGLDLRRILTPSVTSIFQPKEVFFPLYTGEEISFILEARVRQGLAPGTYPDRMLELVTEKTEEAGDLRTGIALLKTAAENAETAGRRHVTEEDIETAFQAEKDRHLRDLIRSLTSLETELLRGIAVMNKVLGCEVSVADIVKEAVATVGTGTSTVYRILKLLDSMRLISLHDHIEDGVRKQFVSVRFEPEVIEGMVG
ncbi:MAG: AAA family ATPase [Euryarchaeota archaeon]|nr:AAA family ATPase [Euryarchaeota archaeon]